MAPLRSPLVLALVEVRPLQGIRNPNCVANCPNASKAFETGLDNRQGAPKGPDGTLNAGAASWRRLKSSTSARLLAVASRMVRGRRCQRHSIILSTDV